jgi:hypothetical protein
MIVNKFHCGDKVELIEDPRHTGVVIAIVSGEVIVKWEETLWKSYERMDAIRRKKDVD